MKKDNNKDFNIFILVGGLGSRLKSLVKKTPKPMLSNKDKPFISYKINNIRKYFPKNSIYLLTYYLSEVFEEFYKNDDKVKIIKESKPLGTGGSIKNAIKYLNLPISSKLIVMNGDTYDNIDYAKLILETNDINMVCSPKDNCDKYNTVDLNNNNYIIRFNKKERGVKNKLINAGCYYFKSLKFFNTFKNNIFSIETRFTSYVKSHPVKSYIYNGPFLDIGTFDDFYKMSEIINKYENK